MICIFVKEYNKKSVYSLRLSCIISLQVSVKTQNFLYYTKGIICFDWVWMVWPCLKSRTGRPRTIWHVYVKIKDSRKRIVEITSAFFTFKVMLIQLKRKLDPCCWVYIETNTKSVWNKYISRPYRDKSILGKMYNLCICSLKGSEFWRAGPTPFHRAAPGALLRPSTSSRNGPPALQGMCLHIISGMSSFHTHNIMLLENV